MKPEMNYFRHEKALVHDGAQIGDGTRIWAFTNIQEKAVIGRQCNICDGSFIENGAVIGDHVTIKHHVAVFTGVTIENDVFVGSNVAFINDRHPRSHSGEDWVCEKTLVKKGASLGSNSTLLCGITIGEYAVIGAGCIVTKDVAAHTIICGKSGETKGYACSCGKRVDDDYKCVCGKTYKKNDQGLVFDG